MIIPRRIQEQIAKDRENYWGEFTFMDEELNKERPPFKWLIDQEVFWDYGNAVNWVIKTMTWGKNLTLNDIQEISRNDEIEKICGKRPPAFAMKYFPFGLGYSCPICSKPLREMDLDNEYELLRLDWSEYKNHMFCLNCNIDIPSFLCANVHSKEHVLFYEEIFLKEIIPEFRNPLLKIIEAKSRAYQNLRNRLKQLKEKKPQIIREWCIHWTDRCSIDGSEECLGECFKYCPDCGKCLNFKNAFCLNEGKYPCMHFEYAKYPSPVTHHFSCNVFDIKIGACRLKNYESCRDISYKECPLQIIEKKGAEN